jgi:hydrophobic/amphiphilic exporter-1 (mainly G- bacteria), HAE1 family
VVPVVYALLDGLRGRLVRALPAASHAEEETGDKAA